MVHLTNHWCIARLGQLIDLYCKLLLHVGVPCAHGRLLYRSTPHCSDCHNILSHGHESSLDDRRQKGVDLWRSSFTWYGLSMLVHYESYGLHLLLRLCLWNRKSTDVFSFTLGRLESPAGANWHGQWFHYLWLWLWRILFRYHYEQALQPG